MLSLESVNLSDLSFFFRKMNVCCVSAPDSALRFSCWNVKGLNSMKSNKVFSHLEHLGTQIAFQQQT